MSEVLVDITELIPENSLLRNSPSDRHIDVLSDPVRSCAPANSRPSVDRVILVEMLRVGYPHGITSVHEMPIDGFTDASLERAQPIQQNKHL